MLVWCKAVKGGVRGEVRRKREGHIGGARVWGGGGGVRK